jgi:hypothetical protein
MVPLSQHMFDTVAATDDTKITPWIIIDGKAAGAVRLNPCTMGSAGTAASSFTYLKLKFFRDILLTLGPYDIK